MVSLIVQAQHSSMIYSEHDDALQDVHGVAQLFSVYVPTNHIYVGDVFLLGKSDIIKVNLSVREGVGKLSNAVSAMLRALCATSCRNRHLQLCNKLSWSTLRIVSHPHVLSYRLLVQKL